MENKNSHVQKYIGSIKQSSADRSLSVFLHNKVGRYL